MSSESQWVAVDEYLAARLAPSDPVLDAALASSDAAGLPLHQVSALQGRFLELIVRLTGAVRVLEIGTLGGYSTIWIARALPPEGLMISLEVNSNHARVAIANIERAGLEDRVEISVGPALETLQRIHSAGHAPFDLVFIDADKPSNPDYLGWALKLTRPGSVIVADNVVRNGAVTDGASSDPGVRGVRRFLDMVADDPRLLATAMQTVGEKGWDGFAMALVVDPLT